MVSGSATSVLSDADSSDPVVRQLQDVERVLVAIKGDTGQLVSGIGFNNNQPEAANQESLRSMFGNKGNSEMGVLEKACLTRSWTVSIKRITIFAKESGR